MSQIIEFSLKSSVLRGVGGLGQKISRCFTSLSSYVRVVYPFHLASLSAYSCILCQARVVLSFTGLPTWNFWDTGWKTFYPWDGKLSFLDFSGVFWRQLNCSNLFLESNLLRKNQWQVSKFFQV